MLILLELASSLANIVALSIAVLIAERWFRSRPRSGGLAEAAALGFVVWTVASFSWLFVELLRFFEDPIVVFVTATSIFAAIVAVAVVPMRAYFGRPAVQ